MLENRPLQEVTTDGGVTGEYALRVTTLHACKNVCVECVLAWGVGRKGVGKGG